LGEYATGAKPLIATAPKQGVSTNLPSQWAGGPSPGKATAPSPMTVEIEPFLKLLNMPTSSSALQQQQTRRLHPLRAIGNKNGPTMAASWQIAPFSHEIYPPRHGGTALSSPSQFDVLLCFNIGPAGQHIVDYSHGLFRRDMERCHLVEILAS